jgi:Rel homology dimerisation domain
VKEDIRVRFYEEAYGGWEGFGEFSYSEVHKQVAISFRTPRFRSVDITAPVGVKIQLWRPSDGATSESFDFKMLPMRKGRRFSNMYMELKKRTIDLRNREAIILETLTRLSDSISPRNR